MLVSIITPTFNQGEYLEETILSVLNQDYRDIEYLVIDGGSTDNSKEVILKYSDRINYWVSEPDKGQADAINKGFRKAKGDLICWINSDDILYSDFVSTRVTQFAEKNIDFIYGDVDQGPDINNRILRKGASSDFNKMLLSVLMPIPQQSAMWRRSVFQKIGEMDIQWHVLLDREYFMRIAKCCSIQYHPGSVAFFRNHSRSKSISEWRKWADELEKYYSCLFSKVLGPEYEPLRKKSMAAMYFKCSQICDDCNDIPARDRYLLLSKKEDLNFYLRLSFKRSLKCFKIPGGK